MIQLEFKKIKSIIGLGNPDLIYQNTYHNLGHIFIDFLKQEKINKKLYKTKNYMNLCGIEILNYLNKNKFKPEEIIIVHDEIDLKLGDFKLSFNKNPAGHKGIINIIQNIKTKNFWRLRIGIHPNINKKIKAEKIILKEIKNEDKIIIQEVFLKIKTFFLSFNNLYL